MIKHCIIPDVQVKPDKDYSYLREVGNYIAEKKPDVIVCIGDFADMPSLSSYDFGKRVFEGRRYNNDVLASHVAMDLLVHPIHSEISKLKKNKQKQWNPRLVLTLGNHEDRINRIVNDDPRLEGTISIDDLKYSDFGWEVHPFLDVVIVDGIAYSHYFTTGVFGRPVSSARALIGKKHMSCVMGHNQKMEIYNEYRADGKLLTGLMGGTCYLHDEDYLGPQGNDYFRGIHMLYEVNDGQFFHHAITLNYLMNRKKKGKNV